MTMLILLALPFLLMGMLMLITIGDHEKKD